MTVVFSALAFVASSTTPFPSFLFLGFLEGLPVESAPVVRFLLRALEAVPFLLALELIGLGVVSFCTSSDLSWSWAKVIRNGVPGNP